MPTYNSRDIFSHASTAAYSCILGLSSFLLKTGNFFARCGYFHIFPNHARFLQKTARLPFICLRLTHNSLARRFVHILFCVRTKENTMQVRKQRAFTHSSVWIDPAVSALLEDQQDEYPGNAAALPGRPHPQSIPVISKSASPEAMPLNNQRRLIAPTTPIPSSIPEQHAEHVQSSRSHIVDAPTKPIPGKITVRLPRASVDELDTMPGNAPDIYIDECRGAIHCTPTFIDVNIWDAPTLPPKPVQMSPSSIDELDTVTPFAPEHGRFPVPRPKKDRLVRQPHSVGTAIARSQALRPSPSLRAKGSAQSAYARNVAERKVGKPIAWANRDYSLHLADEQAHFRDPRDRLRWWLLKPGRIEFILWIVGTILLMAITLSLLFAAAISLAWIVPRQHQTVPTVPVGSNGPSNSRPGSSGGLKLSLNGTNLSVPGESLSVQGQGFTPLGTIMLTHDQNQPCSPYSIKADARGSFTVTINDTSWLPGKHQLIATDHTSGQSITLAVMLTSPTAAVTPPSGSSSTPGTTNNASNQPPVHVAPSPVPTQQPIPTPTPSPIPSPTPTLTPTPGITPTVGVTPTVSPTP
jgi:hypothetical protein